MSRGSLDRLLLLAVDRTPDDFSEGYGEAPPLRCLHEHDGQPLVGIFAQRLQSRFRITVLVLPQHVDRVAAALPHDIECIPLPVDASPPFWGLDTVLAELPTNEPVTVALAQLASADPASLARLAESGRNDRRLTVAAVPADRLPTGVEIPSYGFADGRLGPAFAASAPSGPELAHLLPELRQTLKNPLGVAGKLGVFFIGKVMAQRLPLQEGADALANLIGQPVGAQIIDDIGLAMRIGSATELEAVRARLRT